MKLRRERLGVPWPRYRRIMWRGRTGVARGIPPERRTRGPAAIIALGAVHGSSTHEFGLQVVSAEVRRAKSGYSEAAKEDDSCGWSEDETGWRYLSWSPSRFIGLVFSKSQSIATGSSVKRVDIWTVSDEFVSADQVTDRQRLPFPKLSDGSYLSIQFQNLWEEISATS